MSETLYEVYAVRYAHLAERKRAENFLGGDPRDELMPVDYSLWAIKGGGRAWVVDAGSKQAAIERRGRRWLGAPADALRAIGVDPAALADVVLSHVHWDHAGDLDQFPAATFHIQSREMAYVTGPCMCDSAFNAGFDPGDISRLIEALFQRRLAFHDGDWELAPGLTVHRIGGHTDGLQVVRAQTRRGPVVLASDATHFWENLESGRPFPFIYDLRATREGFRRLTELAGGDNGRVIPGHDSLVLKRFPAVPGHEGRLARLD